jgi:hypothetical protein
VTHDDNVGTCFGFSVRSELAFRLLRQGSGEPLIVSTHADQDAHPRGRLVLRWTLKGEDALYAELYQDGRSFRLWIADTGWFHVDPQVPSVSVPENGNAVRREVRLWGMPAVLCFLARGDLPLHAAAVEVQDEAVLLAAPGSFGKSTLAAGFARAGFRVLSEDTSCVRTSPRPSVIPGPAVLRLREGVAGHVEIPGAERLEAEDERLHLALKAEARGGCDPVPLRAVVFLRPDGVPAKLERVPAAQAIPDLYTLCFRLPGREDAARAFAGVSDLARSVPAWNLNYPLRLEDLDSTVELVARGV